ncbi:uncharacterized protein LOC135462994 [Liolophura sinensis]|uniref:uncharacterized protein LOC135462994 n=1 Tax=Liolophura sinensis TaxID=3198878 RepID=UPI0031589B3F
MPKVDYWLQSATSLMIATAADGTVLPYYVVYRSKHLYDTWTTGGPERCRFNRSLSGWFDQVCFEDWFSNVILPYMTRVNGRKVLIGDNLSSHLSPYVIEKCQEHDIAFVFLPPNSTHLTQPLDVAFFRPMKIFWRQILDKWKISGEGRRCTSIPKDVFPRLLHELSEKLSTTQSENVKSGFKKFGIVPHDPTPVLDRIPRETEKTPEGAGGHGVDGALIALLKDMRGADCQQPKKRAKRLRVEPGKSVSSEDLSHNDDDNGETSDSEETSSEEEESTEASSESTEGEDSDEGVSSHCDNIETEGVQGTSSSGNAQRGSGRTGLTGVVNVKSIKELHVDQWVLVRLGDRVKKLFIGRIDTVYYSDGDLEFYRVAKHGGNCFDRNKNELIMAESKQNRDDVLTCSICMETYRQPVILPCQHSFCRECIHLYADKSKSVQTDETSDSTGSEDIHQQIACPVCRASTSLGREGVAGLPPNFHLAEIVEKFSAVKVEDDAPYCSLCEEENPAKAVKFCTNCGVFYCQECLNYHPMKGPLKRHRLISSLEYLSQKSSQGQGSWDHQSTQQPSCAGHGQPFILYCVPCRMVICLGCVVDHPKHAVLDIKSAAENDKPAILNKISELEKVLQETRESLSGVMRLHKEIQVCIFHDTCSACVVPHTLLTHFDYVEYCYHSQIQENQELHTQEVEKAYCAALEALQAWRQHSLDGMKTRYSQWSVECSAILKHFQLQAQEMEGIVQASKDLLASMDVEFLQGSTGFSKTIDDQLNEIRADLEKHEVSKQKLLDFIQRDLVVPRHLTVKETAQESQDLEATVSGHMSRPGVTKPTLRFTETDDSELRITDCGCVVKGEGLSWGMWRRAVTDGRYQTGRYYWEIHITCSHGCNCRVGVIQESCGVSEETDPGRNSWYIGMVYSGDKVEYYSPSGGEIKPDYLQYRRYTRPHHLGVYLDCDKHTLTVLDCDNNQVMYTDSGVVVTEPLVPSVGFYVRFGSVSARLVTLPPVLCDMISTS